MNDNVYSIVVTFTNDTKINKYKMTSNCSYKITIDLGNSYVY